MKSPKSSSEKASMRRSKSALSTSAQATRQGPARAASVPIPGIAAVAHRPTDEQVATLKGYGASLRRIARRSSGSSVALRNEALEASDEIVAFGRTAAAGGGPVGAARSEAYFAWAASEMRKWPAAARRIIRDEVRKEAQLHVRFALALDNDRGVAPSRRRRAAESR